MNNRRFVTGQTLKIRINKIKLQDKNDVNKTNQNDKKNIGNKDKKSMKYDKMRLGIRICYKFDILYN